MAFLKTRDMFRALVVLTAICMTVCIYLSARGADHRPVKSGRSLQETAHYDVRLQSHPYNQPNSDKVSKNFQRRLQEQQEVVHQPSQEVLRTQQGSQIVEPVDSLRKHSSRSQSSNSPQALNRLRHRTLSLLKKPRKKPRKKQKQRVLFVPPLPSSAFNHSSSQSSNFSIPFMGNYTCQNHVCLDLLSPLDLTYYKYCLAKVLRVHQKTDLSPAHCHFMDGRNRAAVALASFPGSGNTWVRGLLEQATGLCTGAIYFDDNIRIAGFIGEGIRSGAVIAVKTHKREANWTGVNKPRISKTGPSYGSAILVIRNPLDALIAEWNREESKGVRDSRQNGSSHVKSVGRNYFGKNRMWNMFVKRKITMWQSFFVGWLLNSYGHPVLVVRFEDLKTDIMKEVKRMLEFLKVPYSEEELTKRMMQDTGTFRREHHKVFDHFTAEQRSTVHSAIRKVIQVLKLRNGGDTLGIEDYLRSSTT